MHYGIIAAGEGSRLRQEGAPCAKPLLDIDGRPMLERLVDIMISDGQAESISLIVNEEMHEVQSYAFGLAGRVSVPMTIVVRSTPSSMHSFKEVAGAILATAASRQDAKGRYIVTTVDTIFRPSALAAYARSWDEAPAGVAGLMGVTSYIDDEKPLYVATGNNMTIKAFEDTPSPDIRYVSGGVYGLDHQALPVLAECLRTGVSRMRNFQRALLTCALTIKAFDMGEVFDVDHLSDLEKANRFARAEDNRKISTNIPDHE